MVAHTDNFLTQFSIVFRMRRILHFALFPWLCCGRCVFAQIHTLADGHTNCKHVSDGINHTYAKIKGIGMAITNDRYCLHSTKSTLNAFCVVASTATTTKTTAMHVCVSVHVVARQSVCVAQYLCSSFTHVSKIKCMRCFLCSIRKYCAGTYYIALVGLFANGMDVVRIPALVYAQT